MSNGFQLDEGLLYGMVSLEDYEGVRSFVDEEGLASLVIRERRGKTEAEVVAAELFRMGYDAPVRVFACDLGHTAVVRSAEGVVQVWSCSNGVDFDVAVLDVDSHSAAAEIHQVVLEALRASVRQLRVAC